MGPSPITAVAPVLGVSAVYTGGWAQVSESWAVTNYVALVIVIEIYSSL